MMTDCDGGDTTADWRQWLQYWAHLFIDSPWNMSEVVSTSRCLFVMGVSHSEAEWIMTKAGARHRRKECRSQQSSSIGSCCCWIKPRDVCDMVQLRTPGFSCPCHRDMASQEIYWDFLWGISTILETGSVRGGGGVTTDQPTNLIRIYSAKVRPVIKARPDLSMDPRKTRAGGDQKRRFRGVYWKISQVYN